MNAESKVERNVYEFKAEMKRLLHLIAHSLYTHPEVFLRELVSNSSDALNKIRFKKLTNPDILQPEAELKISISLDKENGVFSIEDTGTGMNKEELISQLGTVASSGTLAFFEALKEKEKSIDAQLIGQFGVGFYSVFMVTDEVEVETRSAEPDSEGLRWRSQGESSFTIEEIEKENRGTKITFKLKEEHKIFAEEWKIKDLLNKYSNFIDFPIYIGENKVNTIQALWHKKKDDIKDDELNEFYKFISHDWQEPLGHLHLNIEGNVNFKAILFVPQSAPPQLFGDNNDKSLHLYSKKVFIQDDAKELLPDYLRFIKGVVDTEDLPLNVSREVTQSTPAMQKLRNVLTGRILSMLEDWAEKDKEKYEKFFRNFGPLFKTGINSDFNNKERLMKLLRFESTASKADSYVSLSDYVAKMDTEQKEIYYLSGPSKDSLLKNPNIEYFVKNGIEVLLLSDPVDVFIVPYLGTFEGKEFKSIEKADIDIKETPEAADKEVPEENKSNLISKFKEILGDKVEDVVESKRLVESPVTLVIGKEGMDLQMERMMQMLDKDFSGSKKILEINLKHPILKNLVNIYNNEPDSELITDAITQLYEGALLLEGYLKDPNDFVRRMNKIIEISTK